MYRVFGGVNGNYGTGIQEMVTAGDRWDKETGNKAIYDLNGRRITEAMKKGIYIQNGKKISVK